MRGFLQRVLDRLESGHHALTRSDGAALAECWWLCRLDDPAAGGRPAHAAGDIASAKAILVYDYLVAATPGKSGGAAAAAVERLASTLEALAPDASILLAVPNDDEPMIEAVGMAGERLGTVSASGTVRPNRGHDGSPADDHPEVPVDDQDLVRVATALGEVFRTSRSTAG